MKCKNARGFTLIELMMVGLISSAIVTSIFGVYFKVANIYSEQQRASNIQHEGEWILDLIENGGGYGKENIYGLSSMIQKASLPNLPNIGYVGGDQFADMNGTVDYRIEFALEDDGVSSPRYAEFVVEFNAGDLPTANLYFRILDEAGTRSVLLTDKLMMERFDSTPNPAIYGNYNRTSFKAEKIVDSGSNVIGIRISFYLVDFPPRLEAGEFRAVRYNYRLDRETDPPITDEEQKRRFMGSVPYPQYFSRTIYFPNAD